MTINFNELMTLLKIHNVILEKTSELIDRIEKKMEELNERDKLNEKDKNKLNRVVDLKTIFNNYEKELYNRFMTDKENSEIDLKNLTSEEYRSFKRYVVKEISLYKNFLENAGKEMNRLMGNTLDIIFYIIKSFNVEELDNEQYVTRRLEEIDILTKDLFPVRRTK